MALPADLRRLGFDDLQLFFWLLALPRRLRSKSDDTRAVQRMIMDEVPRMVRLLRHRCRARKFGEPRKLRIARVPRHCRGYNCRNSRGRRRREDRRPAGSLVFGCYGFRAFGLRNRSRGICLLWISHARRLMWDFDALGSIENSRESRWCKRELGALGDPLGRRMAEPNPRGGIGYGRNVLDWRVGPLLGEDRKCYVPGILWRWLVVPCVILA